MRQTLITVLLLLAAPFARAEQLTDDSLTKGLLNLATMRQLASALDYERVVRGSYRLGSALTETATLLGVDVAQLRDPWGTPYRIDVTEKSYRIVGAGNDRLFEAEPTWATKADTTSLAADSVLAGHEFVRSGRTWLIGLVTDAQKNEQSLATVFPHGDVYRYVSTPGSAWAWLRINELEAEQMKGDPKLDLMRSRITQDKIKTMAEAITKYYDKYRTLRGFRVPRVDDEWGLTLRVDIDKEMKHYRIVSAGADKIFNEASWSLPMTRSFDEDLVFEDGNWKRVIDLDTLAKAFLPPELQALGSMTKKKTTGGEQIYKVGGDVSAPVAMVRGEVPYPAELDGMRKIGIAEVTIDSNGKVVSVKPMLGLSPAADRTIAEALSRWEFRPATRAGQPVAVIYNVTLALTPPK
jgi:hypothetical protein